MLAPPPPLRRQSGSSTSGTSDSEDGSSSDDEEARHADEAMEDYIANLGAGGSDDSGRSGPSSDSAASHSSGSQADVEEARSAGAGSAAKRRRQAYAQYEMLRRFSGFEMGDEGPPEDLRWPGEQAAGAQWEPSCARCMPACVRQPTCLQRNLWLAAAPLQSHNQSSAPGPIEAPSLGAPPACGMYRTVHRSDLTSASPPSQPPLGHPTTQASAQRRRTAAAAATAPGPAAAATAMAPLTAAAAAAAGLTATLRAARLQGRRTAGGRPALRGATS